MISTASRSPRGREWSKVHHDQPTVGVTYAKLIG
jgi:hypothetical protein